MQKSKGFIFDKVGEAFNDFYSNHIPFELTGAQKRVLKEIRKDFSTGHHMNRLLQGDVGSGKTLVALLSMLLAVGNDFQAAIIAPTAILATQHYESIKEMLEPLSIEVELLIGSVKKKDRKPIHEGLIDGRIKISGRYTCSFGGCRPVQELRAWSLLMSNIVLALLSELRMWREECDSSARFDHDGNAYSENFGDDLLWGSRCFRDR